MQKKLTYLLSTLAVFVFPLVVGAQGLGDNRDDAGEIGEFMKIAGYVVILAFWGIINILTDGIGLGGESLDSVPNSNLIGN